MRHYPEDAHRHPNVAITDDVMCTQ